MIPHMNGLLVFIEMKQKKNFFYEKINSKCLYVDNYTIAITLPVVQRAKNAGGGQVCFLISA